MDPIFLLQEQEQWPGLPELQENLNELKVKGHSISASACDQKQSPVLTLAAYYSSWERLKRGVAWIRRIISKLLNRDSSASMLELNLSEFNSAKRVIVQQVQTASYAEEMKRLQSGQEARLSSSIVSLDPKYDAGLLRVGGRLQHATDLEYDGRHPLILPSEGRVTELLIQDIHEKVGHEGRQHVLAELRRKFWVIRANAAVRRCLLQCISCRRRMRPVETQKMADLPSDRVRQAEHPWQSTGVDLFGPFYTRRGRAQTKRYGVIFTCLAMRAVHIEVAESLSTDSFICALRRFIARRGSHVRIIRSDNGTNFVGADRELKREVDMLMESDSKIFREAINRGIEWHWNPPGSSHFG